MSVPTIRVDFTNIPPIPINNDRIKQIMGCVEDVNELMKCCVEEHHLDLNDILKVLYHFFMGRLTNEVATEEEYRQMLCIYLAKEGVKVLHQMLHNRQEQEALKLKLAMIMGAKPEDLEILALSKEEFDKKLSAILSDDEG